MQVAVIAHYDPQGIWDENFVELIRLVTAVVDRSVVVTTGQAMPDLPPELKNVVLVRRPNVGYDFYSYRVGLYLALAESEVDGVFLLNSSLILLNADRFRKLLKEMSSDSKSTSVRSVTCSSQFGWHLQSYLLYFDLKKLPVGWLQWYFERVEPLNTKLEVVLCYEIGLGHALQADGIEAESIFKPTIRQEIRGTIDYIHSLSRDQSWKIWFQRSIWSMSKEVNWTHFCANVLAQKYGFVKAEVLRTNPHQLPLQCIWDECSQELCGSVEQSLDRTSKFYISGQVGLTELSRTMEHDSLGIILEVIDVPLHRWANSRIAVVVHLFYVELFEEILSGISNIVEPLDLYVTTPFQADLPQIIEKADQHRQSVTIVITKNQGRDVGPFIALFRSGCLNHYDAVLKLHSKKSTYSEKGDFWRRELYDPLCGDSFKVLRTLSLLREGGCGVIGQPRYFLTNPSFWGANRERLVSILKSCGIEVGNNGPELAFFAGSMFWFVPAALSRIQNCGADALDFEQENGMQDGTLAHAWERAFCLIARSAGFQVSTVDLNGSDVFALNNFSNRVPVLEC